MSISAALKYASDVQARRKSVFEQLMYNEEILCRKGFHKMSPWWKKSLRAFYRKEKTTRMVLRVGRRGGKSSTLCRVAVAELMAGGHKVPAGDVAVFGFILIGFVLLDYLNVYSISPISEQLFLKLITLERLIKS